MAEPKRPVRIHRVDDGNDDDAIEPAGSANTVEFHTSMLKNYDETLLTQKIYAEQAEQTEQLQG